MKAKDKKSFTIVDTREKVKPMHDDLTHGPDGRESVPIPVDDGGYYKKVAEVLELCENVMIVDFYVDFL